MNNLRISWESTLALTILKYFHPPSQLQNLLLAFTVSTQNILPTSSRNILMGMELQKAKYPDLDQARDKVYVKWLGFSLKHNSWINEKDIL